MNVDAQNQNVRLPHNARILKQSGRFTGIRSSQPNIDNSYVKLTVNALTILLRLASVHSIATSMAFSCRSVTRRLADLPQIKMTPEQVDSLVRVRGPAVFAGIIAALKENQERLEIACAALETQKIPFVVTNGNAVAESVATIDDGALRITRDVDILVGDKEMHALHRLCTSMDISGILKWMLLSESLYQK
jgi:hypothetical protein